MIWWRKRKTDHPGPITSCLRDAAKILGRTPHWGVNEGMAIGDGFLFQAQIIRELALRIVELESKIK